MNTSVTSLSGVVTLYLFTSGRMIVALQGVADAIKRRKDSKLAPIAKRIARAVKQARALNLLEAEFKSARTRPRGGVSVVEIDTMLDRALVAFRNGARAHVESAIGEKDDAAAEMALALLNACFPEGVGAVIRSRFADQLAAVDTMLARIEAHHRPTIEKLGLQLLLARVVKLNEAYRRAQAHEVPRELEFGKIREVRARAHEMLLQIVTVILGRFPDETKAHIEARTTLLAPVLFHNDVIGEAMRGRRGVAPDVDPDTGATIEEPDDAESPDVDPPAPASADAAEAAPGE